MSTSANAAQAYQIVSRAARDQGCPGRCAVRDTSGVLRALFKDIADAPHGMNQLLGEWIVDLGAQPPEMDIHDVGVAIEVHVPDLFGDQCPRKNLRGAV